MNIKHKALCGGALLLMCAFSVVGQIEKKLELINDPKAIKGALNRDAGRFRVTLTGFTVNKQSSDNILESDGKGDEVFFIIDSARYDGYTNREGIPIYAPFNRGENLRAFGELTERHSLQSIIFGDVNNQKDPVRICAGSASQAGGLRTGDRYPTNEPWNASGALQRDRLPMLLWEGELRDQRDLVVLIPTIWEWDGGNIEMRTRYSNNVNLYLMSPDAAIAWDRVVGQDLFGAGDRPIGLLQNAYTWAPGGLFLTYATAQRAATTSPSRYGTGVVEFRYAYQEKEDYSIYLKIERLPQLDSTQ